MNNQLSGDGRARLTADAWQMARYWGVSPGQALQRMQAEGWVFVGYNWDGQEAYEVPDEIVAAVAEWVRP